MTKLNDNLAFFSEFKPKQQNWRNGNEMLLHSMSNGWGKKYLLYGLYFEAAPLKNPLNMFGIYENCGLYL